MLGDQDGPVIDAEMVDRAPWNRSVGRPGSQARAMSSSQRPTSLRAAVSTTRRSTVPYGSIRVTTTLISPVCPLQLHSAGGQRGAGGLRACPSGFTLPWLLRA